MRRQWRKFLKNNEKNRLYKEEISYIAVPWLVTFLHSSIKKGNKKDVDSILDTLREKHGITLDEQGNLCFSDDYLPF
jgi:hypothetical protein